VSLHTRPRRLRNALLAVALALTVTSIVVQLLTSPVGAAVESPWRDASLLLNSAAEQSIANVYSAILLAGCALAAAVIAKAKWDREPYALHWAGLALVLGFMAIDEGTGIHESTIGPLQNAIDAHGPFLFTWVIPWGIAAGIVALAYFRFCRDLPDRTRTAFVGAGLTFVGAALGLEMVEGVLFETTGYLSLEFAIAITAEELIEMCALAVLAYALLIEVEASVGTLRLERPRDASESSRGLETARDQA
jgi:hypothetical protein